MNNKIISAGQLFIMMFVIRVTVFFMLPSFLGSGSSLWTGLLPFMIFSVISLISIFPLDFYYKTETDESYMILFLKIISVSVITAHSLLIFEEFALYFVNEQLNSVILLGLFFAAVIYAVRSGIEAVVRFSAIVFVLIISVCFAAASVALPSSSVESVPDITNTMSSLNINSIISPAVLFSDTTLVFCLCRNIKGSFRRCMGMWCIFSSLVAGFFILLTGTTMNSYLSGVPFPFFHIIDINGNLQRFDPVFIGIALSGLFCYASSGLYILSDCIKSLTVKIPALDNKALPISCSVIVLLFISAYYYAPFRSLLSNSYLYLFIVLLFAFIIPLSEVLISKIRIRSGTIKKYVKAAVSVFTAVIFSVLLSGCMPVQLNQRIIVQGIGIDRDNNSYKATILAIDTDSKDNENSVKLISYTADTVPELLIGIENQRGKQLLFSQCLFIMMNRSSAENINDTIGCFSGRRDIIKTINLMACEDSSAELLQKAVNSFGYHAEDISIITDSKASGQGNKRVTLFDYISAKNSGKENIQLPVIEIDNENRSLFSEKQLN